MKISRRAFARALAASGSAVSLSRLLGATEPLAKSVQSPKLQLDFSANGSITNAHFRGLRRSVSGEMRLAGCAVEGNAVIHRSGQAISFEREISCGQNRAHVVNRFSPIADGIRWRVEVTGEGDPWTGPIEFHLRYPVTPDVQFWTAWADPDPAQNPAIVPADAGKPDAAIKTTGSPWHDPLATMPLRDRKLYYGAPPFDDANPRRGFVPSEPDLFSIPVATFSESSHDAGLSVALALDDTLLDLTLDTSDDGSIVFTHLFHRISAQTPVSFTVDLVPHEAGWRGGLRHLVQQYPDYFDPANTRLAYELSGTAAYLNSRGPSIDPAKMTAMAFRTIWVASYDFPYMGLFLPPVADHESWPRFSPQAASGRRSSGTTTVQEMAEYARQMRALGFHVLNYFNVTEFGAHMSEPWKAAATSFNSAEWEDPREFLKAHFPAAVLRNPDGNPYYSWGGAVAMDPGDPAYQEFLIEQARRQLKSFPDSDGFCIDRLDWLRFYNENRDDHASWFDDNHSASLVIAWRQLMDKLAPEVHAAGKILFVNNHTKRIDLLRCIDGIYDEFAYYSASLNTTALLGARRPVLGWTRDADNLRPDPDAYFQRNLYLGVYPTAPVPGNNHCILPDPWVDQQYLDYGSLLDAMRGKQWVLFPHSIRVITGTARANLFETPAGYVVPVVLGGVDKEAVVELEGVKAQSAEALHPGSSAWRSLQMVSGRNGNLQIAVPLIRGCAMLRLH
jgi:hypothetical protein